MKKSFFFKIFSGYLFLTTILCIIIIVFSFYAIRSSHKDVTSRDLTSLATALKNQFTPLVHTKDARSLDALVKKLGTVIHTRITIIVPNGNVLADSEENPRKMDNHSTRTEVAQALEGNIGTFLRVSDTLKQEMLYVALPVFENGKVLYVLRVSRFLKQISTTTNILVKRIIIIAFLCDILALLFAFVFSGTTTRPLKELNAAFQRAAQKDFNVKVLLKRNDEFRELAENFNYMIAETKNLISEISGQKEELDGIISSLREGIVVLDREERIHIANESMELITASPIEKNRFYWELIREPKLSELVRRVREDKSSSTGEIEVNNRIFLCSATFLSQREEIAIIFHDITDIRRMEKIKSDFVLNVSHELRTPLTSIKGFIETIETNTLDDENRRYLEIIKRNTDRLISIVNDLLVLSELEEKGYVLHRELINPKSIVKNVVKIFEQQARTKGVAINIECEPDIPDIQGDPFKLEQVFINLIDNALRYTENGSISISVQQKGQTIHISVSDTGTGIPPEHKSRIFERFYVADKSRSRRHGGTGLGLSIVKHIVLLHGGTITVKSESGKGSTFLITLPLIF